MIGMAVAAAFLCGIGVGWLLFSEDPEGDGNMD